MRALSLWQPWATALTVMRLGTSIPLKRFETRGWKPDPDAVGQRIAFSASKSHKPRDKSGNAFDLHDWWMKNVKRHEYHSACFAAAGFHDFADLPFGKIVCHGVLSRVASTEQLVERGDVDDTEAFWGDYSAERFGWEITDLVVLPVAQPVTGRQGIFWWEEKAA